MNSDSNGEKLELLCICQHGFDQHDFERGYAAIGMHWPGGCSDCGCAYFVEAEHRDWGLVERRSLEWFRENYPNV